MNIHATAAAAAKSSGAGFHLNSVSRCVPLCQVRVNRQQMTDTASTSTIPVRTFVHAARLNQIEV